MEEIMPEFLHMPLQVLWFDTSEITLIALLYIAAVLFGGVMWLALLVGPVLVIPYKRSQPRGFFSHLLYMSGWQRYAGYPEFSQDRFSE